MISLVELMINNTGLVDWEFLLLCAISCLGSLITASIGIGGGTLMLATMALLMPPAVLIPIHGVVQLGSNFGRALLFRREIIREIIPMFLIGTIIGVILGGQVVVALPVAVLQFILSIFILYTVWVPTLKALSVKKFTFFGIGAFGAFATMFVGATGPLMTPFVAAITRDRKQVVGTQACLLTIQHTFKLIAFGLIGFSFVPYLPLIISLIIFQYSNAIYGNVVDIEISEFLIGFTTLASNLRFDILLLLFLLPVSVGLLLKARNGSRNSVSLIVLISGTILVTPVLEMITDYYFVYPYRYVPLIVFFAIGLSTLFSKK